MNLPHYPFIIVLTIVFNTISCTSKKHFNSKESQSKTQWTETCQDWDDWDKPGPPFQIYGNSYYVGTCGISSILVTGDQGHILIDSGTESGAEVVAANIKALGFTITDVKVLLHSHEHFDHVGGLAQLQKISGAKLLASAKAAPVLETGLASRQDPQAGMLDPFQAAQVDAIVHEGQTVTLGSLALTPIATPGHTSGALSWQWQSCENDRCLSVVYADSLSPISNDHYFFSDHPDYLDAYNNGLKKLSSLDCQIVLAPHPSASKMRSRLASTVGLIDTQGCENYAERVRARLNNRLIKEQEKKADINLIISPEKKVWLHD